MFHLYVNNDDWNSLRFRRIHRCQKKAFLISWVHYISLEVIQKLSAVQLHDHMCQASPYRVWYWNYDRRECMKSWAKGGFFKVFTEKTLLGRHKNFHTSQELESLFLWPGTIKPSLVSVQNAFPEWQLPKECSFF